MKSAIRNWEYDMTKIRLTWMTPIVAAVVLYGGSVVPAYTAEYRIDTLHSFINFRTKHLGFSWLVGRFNHFDGSLTYDPEAGPEAQSIEVEIDVTSVDTNHAERDKHLRGARYLNVSEHSTANFVSTGFEGDLSGGVMSGDLTLNGQTRPISFKVQRVGEGDDPWGGYRVGFEAETVITPSEFGINYNLGPHSMQVIVEMLIEAIRL